MKQMVDLSGGWEMTREDNEMERLVRDRIIQGNRDGFAERQFEDAQIRMAIKIEKIVKIIFTIPVLMVYLYFMRIVIQWLYGMVW